MKSMLYTTLLLVLVCVLVSTAAQRCICTQEYAPVCSTSGVTFQNRCYLNCAGQTFAGNGKCSDAVDII